MGGDIHETVDCKGITFGQFLNSEIRPFFTYGFNVYCDGKDIDDNIWNDYLDAHLVGIDINYGEGVIAVNITTQKEQ